MIKDYRRPANSLHVAFAGAGRGTAVDVADQAVYRKHAGDTTK